jgi:ketosteroid isomerase-like protein
MRIRNGWLDAWEEMEVEVEDIVDQGDQVVASLHVWGRGKSSGAEVDVMLHLHFQVRDDKIVYLYEHTDKRAALEAMARSEQNARAES